jgi:NAD(P)-dependent dehydrogenase (short-subunit alcohol dehydrogenase family)
MPSIFITGSNRGLGLEWVRQYAQDGWDVFATCRDPEHAADLKQIAYQYPKVVISTLDVTKTKDIRAAATQLAGRQIDMLINNAGVYFEQWGKSPLGGINYTNWEETFRVNTLGPARVTEALVKNVALSERKTVVAISSHMGSIADITSGNDYAYRSSKAALNATMKGMAYELKRYDITVIILHPGWVRTRMGGANAPVTPTESVSGMRRVIAEFKPEWSGAFFRYDGQHMPW